MFKKFIMSLLTSHEVKITERGRGFLHGCCNHPQESGASFWYKVGYREGCGFLYS